MNRHEVKIQKFVLGKALGVIPILACALLATTLSMKRELAADVLLLQNQNVLEGTVRRSKTQHIVQVKSGGTIYVRNEKVQAYCHDLEGAYQFRLKRTNPKDIQQQISLAYWCLQLGLDHRANDRFVHLSRIDANDSRIAALGERLRANASRTQPRPKRVILPASHSRPIKEKKTNASTPISGESLLQFKRTVQPLLFNRCGQIACHGSQSKNDFKLVRFGRSRFNRELTHRNLQSVFQFIDRHEPANSELLTKATQVHASQRRSALNATDIAQIRRLEAWIQAAVSNGDDASDQRLMDATGNASDAESSANLPSLDPSMNSLPHNLQMNFEGDETSKLPSFRFHQETIQAHVKTPDEPTTDRKRLLNQDSAADKNRNPFDPEQFNRRFGSNKSTKR